MKDFDIGMTFPINYTKADHEGTTQIEIVHVAPDLKWQSIGSGGEKR
jgi:hypothetical protein